MQAAEPYPATTTHRVFPLHAALYVAVRHPQAACVHSYVA